MSKFEMLVVFFACLQVLQLLDTGHCIEVSRNLSPPEGTVIAEVLGPTNVVINCDQLRNNNGNFTQVTTLWSFRFAANPDDLILYTESIHPEFEVNGTVRDNPGPFPTFRNMLTIVSFTERLDGTRIFCGQGSSNYSLLVINEWNLRIYRPPTLRTNFSVKVVERDGNIPVDLSLEPAAFPTPGVFQWSRNDMPVNPDGVNYTYPTALFQRLITRSDSGDYKLTATNHRLDNSSVEVGTSTGNFILDVLYGPDLTPGPMQHYVLVGDPVSLVCGTPLDSNPGATITWTDIQGMEIENTGRYTFDNGPDIVQLNFSFTRAGDTGVWTCKIVVIDNDVMTASGGMLVPRDSKEVGEEMYPIMLTVVVPPSEPRNVAVDIIDATQATLSWRVPSDLGQPMVSRYEITADDLTNGPIKTTTLDNAINSQTITGLLPGVSYQFTVRAISEGGDVVARGNVSTPVSMTTSVTVPAPVCNSAMSANGIITVRWSYTHTGGLPLTNLSVFYTFREGLNQVDGTKSYVDVDDISVMVSGLEAGTDYTFSVVAVNSRGSAVSECEPTEHREGVPTAPKPPIVVSTGIDRVQITLDTLAPGVVGNDPLYYDVRYRSVPDGSVSEVTFTVLGGGMTVEEITGLTQGLTYTFSARSRNNFGMSVYKDSGTVTLDATTTTTASQPPGPEPVMYTGVVVGVSVVVTFILSVLLGLVVGVTLTYFIMVRKIRRPRQPDVQGPTAPAPVYEEVSSPKDKEIELETNLAYGPVRR